MLKSLYPQHAGRETTSWGHCRARAHSDALVSNLVGSIELPPSASRSGGGKLCGGGECAEVDAATMHTRTAKLQAAVKRAITALWILTMFLDELAAVTMEVQPASAPTAQEGKITGKSIPRIGLLVHELAYSHTKAWQNECKAAQCTSDFRHCCTLAKWSISSQDTASLGHLCVGRRALAPSSVHLHKMHLPPQPEVLHACVSM